jgi:hypothetical protein
MRFAIGYSVTFFFGLITHAFIVDAEAAVLSNGGQNNAPFGGNLCADITASNPAPGTIIQIWSCNGALNQQFSFMVYNPPRTSTFEIINPGVEIFAMGGTMCLGVSTYPVPPVSVTLQNCSTFATWQYVGGQIQTVSPLVPGIPALCLVGGAIGTPLSLWGCDGSAAQQWQIK